MKRSSFFVLLFLITTISIACSGSGSNPISPDSGSPAVTNHETPANSGTTKAVWGIWDVSIDTETWKAEIKPARGAQYTVDVVMFLQPPAGSSANLSIRVEDVSEWLTQGLIDVMVGLRHPFPGLNQYAGFDVYGVFVTPGSIGGRYDGDVLYTGGDAEAILLNPDGYTRWMNPTEFPDMGTVLDFTPGRAGYPDIRLFTATINAYKYFADGLDPEADVGVFFANQANVDARGTFKPGSYNERYYELKFPLAGGNPTLIFQYAVVASWIEPDPDLTGDPFVVDVPGDFDYPANADEAIYLGITDNSTLYYVDDQGGGSVNLNLEVYDWGAIKPGVSVPDEVHKIVVEGDSRVIPGGYMEFDQASLAPTAGNSSISSVYQIEIADCTPQSADDVPLLITVENTDPDSFDPGTGVPNNQDHLAAYFRYDAPVAGEIPDTIRVTSPNGGETLWMAMSHEITWDTGSGGIADVRIEWSTDNFVSDVRLVVDSTENDGSYIWAPIPVEETDTARIRISDVDGPESDKSDDDFSIALPVWLDVKATVPINTSTVSFQSWPSYHPNYIAISPAISQDIDGTVHVLFYNILGSHADDAHIKSQDGNYWNGVGNIFGTAGGNLTRADSAKVAPGHQGNSWAAICQIYGYYYCTDIDRLSGGGGQYTFDGVLTKYQAGKFSEIATDSAGYIFFFGDNWSPSSIMWRKTNQPGLTGPGSPGQVGPTLMLATDGFVSHSRSWARQDQGIALIFTTTSGEVRLAETTDAPTNETWDTDEVVFDGSGYSNVTDPALCADSTERLFAIWTGRDDQSGKYQILASMRETVDGPWTDPVIVTSSTSAFDDIHISSQEVNLPTGTTEDVAVVGWSNQDEVGSALSPLDLMAFLPSQQVSDEGTETRDPDVMCISDQFGYDYDVLFAYSWNNSGDWDCAINNADFETP